MELDDVRLEATWPAQATAIRGKIPVLVTFLLGVLLIIGIAIYTRHAQNIRRQYVTQTRLAVQIKTEATSGHLFLEESLLAGDEKNIRAAREHFAITERNVNLLLSGGELDGNRISPLHSQSCRDHAEDIRDLLAAIAVLAEERWTLGDVAVADSLQDQDFDLRIGELEGHLDQLVTCLRSRVDRHSRDTETTLTVMTGILIVITAACLWLFFTFNRRIDLDFKLITETGYELNATNEELNATNEELTSTIEELQATNEEMEAQYRELEDAHNRLSVAREERLEMASRLSQIVESSPMGLFFYELLDDGDLVLRSVNAAANRITGVDCTKKVGQTIEEAFPPLAGTEIPGRYRAAARDGKPYFAEQVDYDDQEIAGAFEVLAFQSAPMHIAVFFQDITDRIRYRKELESLRRLLDDVIASMPSALITIDGQGIVTHWNSSAETILEAPASAMLGHGLADTTPLLAKMAPEIGEVIAHRITLVRRKLQITVGGRSRLADLTAYPLDNDPGAVIRIDDVTERTRMEELVIQSEKMLSIGGLAAGMAHEINNPLAGILQNAQVLETRLTTDIPANREAAAAGGTSLDKIAGYARARNIPQLLKAIRDSGEHAANIVRNMLSFSRQGESKQSATDLGKLIDETIELAWNDYDLKKSYDFRRIRINREYGSEPVEAICERTKIQQVLFNLLKNGAQAMAETQEKREPEFTIRLACEDAMVRLEVEDNGPGISPEDRTRVFEPFFTTKDNNGGTGLGLSISYFIITENHRGTMEVEPVPEAGTRFIIRLPREESNE